MVDVQKTLRQLEQARRICLNDVAIYAQVVPGILNVISPQAHVSLRRWGSDFLAEAFASPVFRAEEKLKLSLSVLDTVNGYLARRDAFGEDEDPAVVKSAVQCAASLYPLVFSHNVQNPDEAAWSKMTAVKANILRRMDDGPAGVRICCIKFATRVVQMQTPGAVPDPRKPETFEISLLSVPRDHSVLSYANLEAEASGLLDRLLAGMQENSTDALLVTATLNGLSVLLQRRMSVSGKILNALLNFDPFMLARSPPMSGRDKLSVKGMARTTMSLLINVHKRTPSHAQGGRIQQRVDQLRQGLNEMAAEVGVGKRKSGLDEPIDGLDNAKRRKLDLEASNGTAGGITIPPLPPGPVTVAQLFTLTTDPGIISFNVKTLPQEVMVRLTGPLLNSIDTSRLNAAINAVRTRYLEVERRPPLSPLSDDGDYDPALVDDGGKREEFVNITRLERPGPMTNMERDFCRKSVAQRLEQDLKMFATTKKAETSGFNYVATIGTDREAWVTLLIRLATRIGEPGPASPKSQTIQTFIRSFLMNYIMNDWRRNLDVAIAWCNEEWYADMVRWRSSNESKTPTAKQVASYAHTSLTLLSNLSIYLDSTDTRYLTRFLSEIPCLFKEHFTLVKKIADDPDRVATAANALYYLVLWKPPVREPALDLMQSIYTDLGKRDEDKEGTATKILRKALAKWRPDGPWR
ncbi:hypothetical protein K470DRAFT_271831 [Piedraia hortae CBS 480.64]|uniref:Symplekin/Pta1 N-terminal domain-containing protein n=1 Tax=Piedraia hortae CBS 480.64 TaxID=1314780 RepID=A0A6A7BUV7_9PEZI|nr:hypothetical protein K470DRAFT_271831 [Piedraia hortae CBS 480.64]